MFKKKNEIFWENVSYAMNSVTSNLFSWTFFLIRPRLPLFVDPKLMVDAQRHMDTRFTHIHLILFVIRSTFYKPMSGQNTSKRMNTISNDSGEDDATV